MNKKIKIKKKNLRQIKQKAAPSSIGEVEGCT